MTGHSVGLKEATRRTGLSRRQLRYLEERGELGFVARSNGRTCYSAEQVVLLDHIARLRALEVGLGEAAQLAREMAGADRAASDERVDEIAGRALTSVERNSRVAADLVALRRRPRASNGAAGPAPSPPASSRGTPTRAGKAP